MGIQELLQEKRNEILALALRYGARNVRVFGSVARGDASPNSDIDLLLRGAENVVHIREESSTAIFL